MAGFQRQGITVAERQSVTARPAPRACPGVGPARRQGIQPVVIAGTAYSEMIAWFVLGEDDPRWQARRCLYAYLTPDGHEVLYVGLAWGCSVRARWVRSGKDGFWTDLEEFRGIRRHRTLVGKILPGRGRRLRRNLAANLEAVLIAAAQPWGNIQKPRITAKRALCIRNRGPWPGPSHIHTPAA